MNERTLKLLYDMSDAISCIESFLKGKNFDDYRVNVMLRSAVERQFEIMIEALTRIHKADPETAKRITDFKKIISFRNLIVHCYGHVDAGHVWQIIEKAMPLLKLEVEQLKSTS